MMLWNEATVILGHKWKKKQVSHIPLQTSWPSETHDQLKETSKEMDSADICTPKMDKTSLSSSVSFGRKKGNTQVLISPEK